jgi:hypothetical protein
MKTVATALALAALAATPALAAPKHFSHRTAVESDAYAYQAYDAGVVIVDGRYIGRDPDANVRLALIREANNQDSN